MALDRRTIDRMIADVGAEAFQRLARLFEAETREAMAEMRRLLIAGDWRELGRHAHSLKNSTASFGLGAASVDAAALEAAADSGDAEGARAAVTALGGSVEAELGALEKVLERDRH